MSPSTCRALHVDKRGLGIENFFDKEAWPGSSDPTFVSVKFQ